MDMNLVKQYAEFAVKIGVNPQPGQTLIIRAPIEGAFFRPGLCRGGLRCGREGSGGALFGRKAVPH